MRGHGESKVVDQDQLAKLRSDVQLNRLEVQRAEGSMGLRVDLQLGEVQSGPG